jgi:hypothetical protein
MYRNQTRYNAKPFWDEQRAKRQAIAAAKQAELDDEERARAEALEDYRQTGVVPDGAALRTPLMMADSVRWRAITTAGKGAGRRRRAKSRSTSAAATALRLRPLFSRPGTRTPQMLLDWCDWAEQQLADEAPSLLQLRYFDGSTYRRAQYSDLQSH